MFEQTFKNIDDILWKDSILKYLINIPTVYT